VASNQFLFPVLAAKGACPPARTRIPDTTSIRSSDMVLHLAMLLKLLQVSFGKACRRDALADSETFRKA
jgi:hypothetical protein